MSFHFNDLGQWLHFLQESLSAFLQFHLHKQHEGQLVVKEPLSAVKAGSNFFFRPKLVHAWCFETILITNCYIFGSNEGIICVLCTLKINHKHFVSMETAPPIVNKAVNNALRL